MNTHIKKITCLLAAIFFHTSVFAVGNPCNTIAGQYKGTWVEPGIFTTCQYEVKANISRQDTEILINFDLLKSNHRLGCEKRPIFMAGTCDQGLIWLNEGQGQVIGDQIIWQSPSSYGSESFVLKKTS